MKKLMLLLSVVSVSPLFAAAVQAAPTKVMFFFDTEDFTCDESNDAIRDTAKILTEEGVKGEYNIVGYLARELVRLNRRDVIDALRPHAIGTQTLKHSVHPTVCERSDMANARIACANVLADEAEGVGMLKAAFGLRHIDYAVPPGNSWSYASLYAFADLGMTFYGGGGFAEDASAPSGAAGLVPPGNRRWGMWYCNLYQLPYDHIMALEELIPGGEGWKLPDFGQVLDRAAKLDGVVFSLHPHMVIKKAHWDGPNYRGANLVEWGQWKQVENRPKEVTAAFYRNFRAFVRRIKADSRFVFTDTLAEKTKLKPRVVITKQDLPAIKAALEKDFGAISSPASWCVADVFHAVVELLRGRTPGVPGKVHGFVYPPQGVMQPVVVKASDLAEAASWMDLATFIPPQIAVGGAKIGPADFLFAALEVLTTGANEVTVRPREQLGSFKNCPSLETVDIKGGWVIHSPELNGKLLDERLKLQLWTLRFE